MAYSITTNTRFAGSTQGTFLDDLTNPSVGESTDNPVGKEIAKVVVYAGAIIDSVRITYKVENSPTPITVHHGGPGGEPVLSFEVTEITADEKLVAVYGTRVVNPIVYGDKIIIQLSFIVVNYSGNAPTSKVHTASGYYDTPTEKFELSLPFMTASSYTFQPQGLGISYLQGIGFSNVSFQAAALGPEIAGRSAKLYRGYFTK